MQYADLIGIPFRYGGRGPDAYDCFGLTQELQRRLDGRIIRDIHSPTDSRVIAACMAMRKRLYERHDEPFIGAHLLFRVNGQWCHTGMLVDEDTFLHTWEGSGGVCAERLSSWARRFEGGFYRYVG